MQLQIDRNGEARELRKSTIKLIMGSTEYRIKEGFSGGLEINKTDFDGSEVIKITPYASNQIAIF